MKQDKIKQLVNYLVNQNSWVSSEVLTNILQVSPRTLRNYLSEVNGHAEEKIIESSRYGYRLNRANLTFFNKDIQSFKKLPDLPNTRTLYWIRKLLMSSTIDEFEITDKLFTSEVTVKRDLNKVSKIVKFFNLSLESSSNKLSIRGNEFNCRRLGMFCTSAILDDAVFDFETLVLSYKDYPFTKIRKIIEEAISLEPSLSINGYTFNAVFLYVGIAITRLSNEHSIANKDMLFDKKKFVAEYHAAILIKKKLEDLLEIEIPEAEIDGLTLVLASYLTSNTKIKEPDELLVSSLSKYNLNIKNTEKLNNLMDYIRRLYVRSLYGLQMYIPKFTLEYVKIEYWDYYQQSNQILKEISTKKNITYFEEDILGLAILLNTHYQYEKLNCLVIVPRFYKVGDSLINELIEAFSKDLKFTFNQKLDLSIVDKSFNLIITTFPISNLKNIVMISPFLGLQDKINIITKIQEIRNIKKEDFAE